MEFTFSGEIEIQSKKSPDATAPVEVVASGGGVPPAEKPLGAFASYSEDDWIKLNAEMDACFGADIHIVHVPSAPLQWLPWPPKPPHFDEPFRQHLDHQFPRGDDAEIRGLIDGMVADLKIKKEEKEESDRSIVRVFMIWVITAWVAANWIVLEFDTLSRMLEHLTVGDGNEVGASSVLRNFFDRNFGGAVAVSSLILVLLLTSSRVFFWPIMHERRERQRGIANQGLSDILATFGSKMQKVMEQLAALYSDIEYEINKATTRRDNTPEAKQASLESVTRCARLIVFVDRKARYYEERLEASIWSYYRWEHREAIRRFWREVRIASLLSLCAIGFGIADWWVQPAASPALPSYVSLSGLLLLVLAGVRFRANTERLWRPRVGSYADLEKVFWDRMHLQRWTRASSYRLHDKIADILAEQVKDIHKFEDLRR